MTRHLSAAVVTILAFLPLHHSGRAASADAGNQHRPRALLENAPLVFEPAAETRAVSFIARGPGYSVGFSRDRVTFAAAVPAHERLPLSMTIAGASRRARVTAEMPTGGVSHYFVGNDSRRHRLNVPHHARLRVRDVYPGIDVIYYGTQARLEYDFVVSPGQDPSRIRLRFTGHEGLSISPDGDLVMRLGTREVRQTRPLVYQDAFKTPLEAGFAIGADGDVRFHVTAWDRSRPLVIDPVFVFGTYLGGSGNDTGRGVAVDSSGNVYVAGTTASTNFPAVSAQQGANAGSMDAFITKINAAGTAIVYSTYLGGTGSDEGRGIDVDASGAAYITGVAGGTSFPHSGGISTTCASQDGFITKLSAAGSALDFSICFGTVSTDYGNAISVDAQNIAHVTGLSGSSDVFLGALNATGTAWIYSTTIVGSSTDEGFGISSDAAGNVCVAGRTTSSNFPVLNARQPTMGQGAFQSGFVAKYDSTGAAVYRTYLGGSSFDTALAAAIDAGGNCYVTGVALSVDFPTQNAVQPAIAGFSDAFVTAYNSNGSAYIYSTYLGGSDSDSGTAIVASGAGVVHVVGSSSSKDLPVIDPMQSELKDIGGVRKSFNAAGSFGRTALTGRTIQTLAVDPTDAQVVYAGTQEGIYKTTNGGASWVRVDSGLTYTDVRALAIDPNDHCAIYAGIATTVMNISFPGSILVQNTNAVLAFSPNCGASWGIPLNGPSAREIWSLAFTNANPAALYGTALVNAASGGFSTTHHRVFRSLSGTVNFLFTFEDFNYVVATDRVDPCTAYLSGFSGRVQQNTSCGAFNWTQVGATLTGSVGAVAAHPTQTGTLLAGAGGSIYRKPDAVSPWAVVGSTSGAVTSIVYQPGGSQVAYAGTSGGGVYKSTDGGASWNLASVIGPAINALAVSPAAAPLVVAGLRNDSDAFYARVNAGGVVFSLSWIGGYGNDAAAGVALDTSLQPVIVGTTRSASFPVTPGALAGTPSGGGDAFIVKIDPAPFSGGPDMVQNGGFDSGLNTWLLFATDGTNPNNNYISANVVSGHLEFYRVPPPNGSNSAVVLQNTHVPVPAGEPVTATFFVGNSSSVRKRLSVLVHDEDFSDLSVCTFWIPANTSMQLYQMLTHTTEAWAGASISFYAASAGSDGGAYLLDDVTLAWTPGTAADQTTCHDPWAPTAPGGVDGPELLTNGDFSAGTSSWSPFGLLVHQVSGGVFEFYRPAGLPTDPAGVILQSTGQATITDEIITAQFDLGNSSSVRKRVTVLLHDFNFTGLSACTFWLAPGQPLSTYGMRTYSTVPWPNLTLSVYAATVGTDTWTRLDNASLKRTPGQSTTGTDCIEPSWISGLPPSEPPPSVMRFGPRLRRR